MSFRRTALVAALCLGVSNAAVPRSAAAESPALLLEQLTTDLTLLAERRRSERFQGALQLVGGSAVVTAGVFVQDPPLRAMLLLAGSAGVGTGLGALVTLRPAEYLLSNFRSISGQNSKKIELGESALRELSGRARTGRIVGCIMTTTSAGAYVPLSWTLSRRDDPSYRFGDDAIDYLGLTLSVVAAAASVVHGMRPSEAEARLIRYRELKSRGAAALGRRLPKPTLSLRVAHGLGARLQVAF